ncbi:MAG: hypothetical protein ABIA47_00985 [bacterium]
MTTTNIPKKEGMMRESGKRVALLVIVAITMLIGMSGTPSNNAFAMGAASDPDFGGLHVRVFTNLWDVCAQVDGMPVGYYEPNPWTVTVYCSGSEGFVEIAEALHASQAEVSVLHSNSVWMDKRWHNNMVHFSGHLWEVCPEGTEEVVAFAEQVRNAQSMGAYVSGASSVICYDPLLRELSMWDPYKDRPLRTWENFTIF